MVSRRKRLSGFTLLELMTVVAMLMILAAISIPGYLSYVRRSKSGEVATNLNSLYKNAATYYSLERSDLGISTTSMAGACTVDDDGPSPDDPGAQKKKFVATENFAALGFTIADLVYYSYGMESAGSACGNSASTHLYTMYANGDLDGDSELSTFEMSIASDANNILYHGVGFYIDKESE